MSKNIEFDYSLNKLPPQDIELEAAVLGALMIDKEAINEIEDILSPDIFYSTEHQSVCKAIIELSRAGKQVDILTVVSKIRSMGELESVGGASFVAQLTNRIGSSLHIRTHCFILVHKQKLRELIDITAEASSLAYQNPEDAITLIENTEKKLSKITSTNGDKINKMSDLVKPMMDDIAKRYEIENYTSGVSTGINTYDAVISAWQKTDLIIVAARPSMGKTALVISAAINIARRGEPVAIFSLEMSKAQLVFRIASQIANIDTEDIMKKPLNEWQLNELNKNIGIIEQLPIYIDDTPSLSVYSMKSRLRRLVNKKGVKIAFIDYLQLMTIGENTKQGNREQEISTISRTTKATAKELDIPIVALSQLSRQVESRVDKRPMLSDLRECLSAETSLIYTENNMQKNFTSSKKILSLHKGKLTNMQSSNIPKEKNIVYRLKTGTGRFIDCTLKHPILTSDGYKKLSDIEMSDSVALAINWSNDAGEYISESRFIGWMIGNGCMYGYNVPGFITADKDISDQFISFIEKRFGFSPKIHPHYRSKVYQYDITNSTTGNRTKEGNPVTKWLKENNLWGNKAKDKVIPNWFMERGDEKSICELIQGLWETDGSISIGKKKQVISYSTTSLKLANQILYLLAKIGVVANLDGGFFFKKSTTLCYKITINSSDQKKAFINKINLNGQKGLKIQQLKLTSKQSCFLNKIGRETTLKIAEAISGLTNVRVQKQGYRRLTAKKLNHIIQSEPIAMKDFKWLVSDNIFWDTITSIIEIGEVEIFDRSVPKSNNFVVNGIIVHNSGAIEQDADVIAFLYRPEYYGVSETHNGESTTGMAEIITAKNRNGKLGVSIAKFIPHIARFIGTNHEQSSIKPNENFTQHTPVESKDNKEEAPF